jgi:hypothetical protein
VNVPSVHYFLRWFRNSWKWGRSAKDVEWANKLPKRYPGVCYTYNTSQAHAVLFIAVTPGYLPWNNYRYISVNDYQRLRLHKELDHDQQPPRTLFGRLRNLYSLEVLWPDGTDTFAISL